MIDICEYLNFSNNIHVNAKKKKKQNKHNIFGYHYFIQNLYEVYHLNNLHGLKPKGNYSDTIKVKAHIFDFMYINIKLDDNKFIIMKKNNQT